MKTLLAATATAAVFVFAAGTASAQMYAQPMQPAPMPMEQMQQQPMQQMQQPTNVSGPASWMQDDGSSSDYPIHNPGDVSGERLNSQYQGGMDVNPPNGFPAPYRVR